MPGAAVYPGWEAATEKGAADGGLITLPQMLHPRATISALQSGLHVLVEKPLSMDMASARTVFEEARRHSHLAVMVNQNYRWCPRGALCGPDHSNRGVGDAALGRDVLGHPPWSGEGLHSPTGTDPRGRSRVRPGGVPGRHPRESEAGDPRCPCTSEAWPSPSQWWSPLVVATPSRCRS